MVWIQIRTDVLSVLIWIQTEKIIRQNHSHASKERVKESSKLTSHASSIYKASTREKLSSGVCEQQRVQTSLRIRAV